MEQMEAVILTKSAMRKGDVTGACVTAYELKSKRLVRFVSRPDGSPIPYSISNQFNTLDLIRITALKPCPIGPQTENYLVDMGSFQHIQKHERENVRYIYKNYQRSWPLFMQVPKHKLESVSQYKHSLEIVPVNDLVIQKTDVFVKQKVQQKGAKKCSTRP